jgi:DNA-binding response OmpR family regulator
MKALIVDDDRVLADILAYALRREGFQVLQAYDGPAGLQLWGEARPDLIMLSVRCEDEDIIHGLELGADDYIAKPFSPNQLVARARAVLRRVQQPEVKESRQVGELLFEPGHRTIRIGMEAPIQLTPLEGRLLDYLMANSGKELSFDAIIEHVWGPGGGDRDMLRQLVRRLRSKIEPDPTNPVYLKTMPGLGYGLVGEHIMN